MPALFATLEDETPDLRGIDPLHFYDLDTYATLAESLTRRLGRVWLPATVNETIRAVLALGRWTDYKAPENLGTWEIPQWLADEFDVRVAA